jgi:HK97 family phage prohead protease
MEIRLPALNFRAAFEPSSLNREARTVDLVWTTGARVLRGFWDRFWEELSLDPKHVRMERLNAGAPLLSDHTASTRTTIGVVESATLQKKRGVATVRFLRAGVDPEADRVFEKVADGVLKGVSVGYRIHKLEKTEESADKIPVMRAVDWEPMEISITPVGADEGAGVRSAAPETYPCEVITRGAEDAPQEEQNMADMTKTAGARAEASQVDLDAVRAEAAKAERERVAQIGTIVRKAGLDSALTDQLVRDGKPLDEVRAVVLDKLAERNAAHGPDQTPSGAVEVVVEERDKRLRGMEAWLFERAGGEAQTTIELAQRAAKENPAKARLVERLGGVVGDGGEFRGMSLVEMARHCLERAGVRTRGMDRMSLVGLALTHRSSFQSTSDFAVLFESVLHKLLLGAYIVAPDTWRMFCKRDSVPDFRPSNRFRQGSFGVLDAVDEHGEFKNKSIPDGLKFPITTETKGNIIALSRQAIINDDMSSFADLAVRFGRAAGLSIEVAVYALLLANGGLGPTMTDTNPFFHTSRSNINATGSAISVQGLQADRVTLASQKDISSNDYLDLRPHCLVLPIGLGGEARVLNETQFEPVDNKFMKPNITRGIFTSIVDTPRLSGTRRYIFADPNVVPAFVVAFLEGQGEAPVLESMAGWRVDGTEWKIRMDFKAQAFDPKGAVTNAGA